MIDTFPGFCPPVPDLFGLANTEFKPQVFRAACEEFATFNPSSSDDDLWYFSLGGPNLVVALETEVIDRKLGGWPVLRQNSVGCAILSICWWETFQRFEHESIESLEAERAQYDRIFWATLQLTIEGLGSPRLQGQDENEDRHRYAIWRGSTGLLILQQSAYDPQFGLDINYWIHPWSGPDPRPTSPFIDWLCGLTRRDEMKS